MAKTKYTFLYRSGDYYFWQGPRLPGDSRSEVIFCRVTWFWSSVLPSDYRAGLLRVELTES